MGPSFFEVMVLGALQGLTEFLPVSSSGHLALAQMLFGLKEGGVALSVAMHAGTLLSTIVMLRKQIGAAVADGVRALRDPRSLSRTAGGRDVIAVVLASLPTAVIGLALRDAVDAWTKSPIVVALGFVVTIGLLISSHFARGGDRIVPTWLGAVIVGVCQGLAVVPGISRSGATITAALWLGVRRERSFELSMLMSLPAITGAVLLEARHIAGMPGGAGITLAGAAIAFVTGIAALWVLRRLVVRGHFVWFVAWVGPVALATFALAKAWP